MLLATVSRSRRVPTQLSFRALTPSLITHFPPRHQNSPGLWQVPLRSLVLPLKARISPVVTKMTVPPATPERWTHLFRAGIRYRQRIPPLPHEPPLLFPAPRPR